MRIANMNRTLFSLSKCFSKLSSGTSQSRGFRLKTCPVPPNSNLQCLYSNKLNVHKHTVRSCSTAKIHFPLQMDPVGKIAIITGGESGIGLASAKDLLTNGAQMVVLAGISEGESVVNQMSEEFGEGRCCFMNMDVNDPRDFDELLYRVDLVYGGVDILFNNAGILQDQIWEYEVDTNLKSVIKGTLLGLKYMGKEGRGKRKGDGLIINHADVLALDASSYVPAYVATKAGIIYATLSFGKKYHYANTGVRVVGLLSGATETKLVKEAAEKQLDPQWGRALECYLRHGPPQSPEVVGRAMTHLVKYSSPGSLWTVENGTLFQTNIDKWRQNNTMVTQL